MNLLLKLFCLIFALTLSSCQEESPLAEFEEKMQRNAPISPKKYDDGSRGYVFYEKRFGSNVLSKWLLKFSPDIHFSSLGNSKSDKLETTISPNSTLVLIFDVNELRPISNIDAQEIDLKNPLDQNISSIIIGASRVDYVKLEDLDNDANNLPDSLLIPDNCIIGEEVNPGIFNIILKEKNQNCYNNGNRNSFFLRSALDNYYGRVACSKQVSRSCVVYVNFDFNRYAEIFIDRRNFRKINKLVEKVYGFLKASTLAIDDIVFERR